MTMISTTKGLKLDNQSYSILGKIAEILPFIFWVCNWHVLCKMISKEKERKEVQPDELLLSKTCSLGSIATQKHYFFG